MFINFLFPYPKINIKEKPDYQFVEKNKFNKVLSNLNLWKKIYLLITSTSLNKLEKKYSQTIAKEFKFIIEKKYVITSN